MQEAVLKTVNLTKKYGKSTVLDSVNLTVRKGDIYGIIGKNGAGKTTIMKSILGLANKTSGEIELFGKSENESGALRHRIGSLIEEPVFYRTMTVYDNLKYYCYLKGISDLSVIDRMLRELGIEDAKNKKYRKCSLGMKQRLGIALSLLDSPDLVILDEPINGLDPIGISDMRSLFKRYNEDKEVTFVISSHILSELYTVSNRFLFIDKGKVIKEITKEELDFNCRLGTAFGVSDTAAAAPVIENAGIKDYRIVSRNDLYVYDEKPDITGIVKNLIDAGLSIYGIEKTGMTLEEYFKDMVEEDSHD